MYWRSKKPMSNLQEKKEEIKREKKSKNEKVSKFAEKLSQLRKERGISQKKAAAELGISQALLSHYEKGIRECGLDFVIRCSEYYGVTTDYLLGTSESRMGVNSSFVLGGGDENDKNSQRIIAQGVGQLLDLISISKDESVKKYVYDYCTLCFYRGAITMAKAGILPKEMFKLEYSLGRELASAALAVEDARFVFIDDKSRTGTDLKERTALHDLIEMAEEYILSSFYLDE